MDILVTSVMDPSSMVFQAFPDALQLITYFDEVEVCNPLAGHAGVHKHGNGTNIR